MFNIDRQESTIDQLARTRHEARFGTHFQGLRTPVPSDPQMHIDVLSRRIARSEHEDAIREASPTIISTTTIPQASPSPNPQHPAGIVNSPSPLNPHAATPSHAAAQHPPPTMAPSTAHHYQSASRLVESLWGSQFHAPPAAIIATPSAPATPIPEATQTAPVMVAAEATPEAPLDHIGTAVAPDSRGSSVFSVHVSRQEGAPSPRQQTPLPDPTVVVAAEDEQPVEVEPIKPEEYAQWKRDAEDHAWRSAANQWRLESEEESERLTMQEKEHRERAELLRLSNASLDIMIEEFHTRQVDAEAKRLAREFAAARWRVDALEAAGRQLLSEAEEEERVLLMELYEMHGIETRRAIDQRLREEEEAQQAARIKALAEVLEDAEGIQRGIVVESEDRTREALAVKCKEASAAASEAEQKRKQEEAKRTARMQFVKHAEALQVREENDRLSLEMDEGRRWAAAIRHWQKLFEELLEDESRFAKLRAARAAVREFTTTASRSTSIKSSSPENVQQSVEYTARITALVETESSVRSQLAEMASYEFWNIADLEVVSFNTVEQLRVAKLEQLTSIERNASIPAKSPSPLPPQRNAMSVAGTAPAAVVHRDSSVASRNLPPAATIGSVSVPFTSQAPHHPEMSRVSGGGIVIHRDAVPTKVTEKRPPFHVAPGIRLKEYSSAPGAQASSLALRQQHHQSQINESSLRRQRAHDMVQNEEAKYRQKLETLQAAMQREVTSFAAASSPQRVRDA